jgi:hypothetical protein
LSLGLAAAGGRRHAQWRETTSTFNLKVRIEMLKYVFPLVILKAI